MKQNIWMIKKESVNKIENIYIYISPYKYTVLLYHCINTSYTLMLNNSCSPGHSISEERRSKQRGKERHEEKINSPDLGQIKHSAAPDLGSI